jgi:hypothetical protein
MTLELVHSKPMRSSYYEITLIDSKDKIIVKAKSFLVTKEDSYAFYDVNIFSVHDLVKKAMPPQAVYEIERRFVLSVKKVKRPSIKIANRILVVKGRNNVGKR